MGIEPPRPCPSTPAMRRWGILLLTTWAWLGAAEPPACAPRPMVLVHVMPWFESKAVSGRWGWHWTMEKTDPDKGALASHDRPAFGPYDSGDPAVIATQVALMKRWPGLSSAQSANFRPAFLSSAMSRVVLRWIIT